MPRSDIYRAKVLGFQQSFRIALQIAREKCNEYALSRYVKESSTMAVHSNLIRKSQFIFFTFYYIPSATWTKAEMRKWCYQKISKSSVVGLLTCRERERCKISAVSGATVFIIAFGVCLPSTPRLKLIYTE